MLALSKFKLITAAIWSILLVIGMFIDLPITEVEYISIVTALAAILQAIGIVTEDRIIRQEKGLK